MFQFVETICCENGVLRNLDYHTARMNATFRHFWGASVPVDLRESLNNLACGVGMQKVRVVYAHQGIVDVTVAPYVMRSIASLRLVNSERIDYSFKSTDRKELNDLLEQRGECDEVLIVKGDEVTDTSYTNVAFSDGKRWFTPLHPLLCGTMRAALLAEGLLSECQIKANTINEYSAIMLFNAMIAFGELILPTSAIKR